MAVVHGGSWGEYAPPPPPPPPPPRRSGLAGERAPCYAHVIYMATAS